MRKEEDFIDDNGVCRLRRFDLASKTAKQRRTKISQQLISNYKTDLCYQL